MFPEEQRDNGSPLTGSISLAVAASIAGGGIYAAGRYTLQDEIKALDIFQDAARHVGFLSPSSVLNTFRVAEWLSPFVSARKQGLTPTGSKNVSSFIWERSGTQETHEYLREILGREITQNLNPGNYDILFERGPDTGELFIGSNGKWESVGKGFRLFEAQEIGSELLENTGGHKVNTAFHSILANLGLGRKMDRNKATRIFLSETGERSRFIPVPDPFSSSRPIATRLKVATSPITFGLQRFNRGLAGLSDHLPGVGAAERAIGMRLPVQTGPAWELLTRYGLKAGAVVGAGVAIAQLDWMRREYSAPGQIFASAAISAGVAHVAQRLGKSNRFAALAGGVSFLGQMVLPGFDQGVFQGLATAATKLDVLRAGVGKVSLLNTYRRTVEGFLPGFTSWQTSALFGLGVLAASKTSLPRKLIQARGLDFLPSPLQDRIGIIPAQVSGDTFTSSAKDFYWKRVLGPWGFSFEGLRDKIRGAWQSDRWQGLSDLAEFSYASWQDALNDYKLSINEHPLDDSFRTRLEQINARYDESFVGKVGRFVESTATSAVHAVAGAPLEGSTYRETLKALNFGGKLGKSALLFGIGALGHSIISGNLLGSLEDPSELQQVYSGEKYVEVKKNRWWLFGSGEYEGSETRYLRPSAYAMYMARTNQKVIWGGQEDRISPIGKIIRQNFTYELERDLAYDRPQTMSAPAFANFPIIGDLLAGTVGQLIKPTRLVRPGEWIRTDADGNKVYAAPNEYNGPVYELGGLGPGVPVSPYSGSQILGNLSYRGRELEGLTGFVKNEITEALTGVQTFGEKEQTLSTYADVTSLSTAYWNMKLGDLFGATELVRRVVPNKRGDSYNPLSNSMPSWLPDYMAYGDPYSKIEDGAVRLPGPGYASIHRELSGVDPEDYPLLYQYAILADVASKSSEFARMRGRVFSMMDQMTPEQKAFVDRTERRLQRKGKKFQEIHKNAIQLPGSKITQSLWGGFQQSLREWMAPVEYLAPIPGQPLKKFLNDRSAVEDYEFRRLYGSATSMWDKPFRDWVRPALYSSLHNIGWDGKPGWREDADSIQEYFDVLEYLKWMRLAESATNGRERNKYLRKAQGTRFGVDPSKNPTGSYYALPDSEKRYFRAFAETTDEGERERILEMVPEDVGRLYQGIWKALDAGGSLDPYSNSSIDKRYLYSRLSDALTYMQDKPQPDPSWVGFDERIDVDDIKLKYLERIGADIYAYDMWNAQLEMLERKPYLEGAEDFMFSSGTPRGEILRSVVNLSSSSGVGDPADAFVVRTDSQLGSRASIYYNDNRQEEIGSYLNGIQQ